MKTLYIIGNGFDRYHGLDTRYTAFGLYLQDKYPSLYEALITYYGLTDLDPDDEDSLYDPLWSEFEVALANLDFETILEENTDYLANPGSPDFRDRDWHSYEFEMQRIVTELTADLFSAFKKFVLNVSFPDDDDINDKVLALDKEGIYLTFNYTDTLERYYRVPRSRILYIHKKALDPNDVLILGHGVPPESFIPKEPQPPEDASDEELDEWRDNMADNYDYSYESGKAELLSYFSKSFKKTSNIITENRAFFQGLKDIEKVVVLGHSLADVDKAYLKAVFDSIQNKNVVWTVSFYGNKEKDSHYRRLKDLGLSDNQINLIGMDSLKAPDHQLKLEFE